MSLDPILDAQQVAVVGSPSTNSQVTLDLVSDAIHAPLVGRMLLLKTPLTNGEELALGTVTEVTTVNTAHTDVNLRPVVKQHGFVMGRSGDLGDVRDARIKIQAVYKRTTEDGIPGHWRQSGPSLRNSPPTATPVREVTNEVITALMAEENDLHYLGHLHGTDDVTVPFSIRDFSGPRGAFHKGIFGMSGSGKSAYSAYLFASQMRHKDLGFIIIDPQGQWASETGLPFSLQEWAREMGREVVVRRISEDLRLQKDGPLFGELLLKSKFVAEITKMSAETAVYFIDELVKILRKNKEWDETESAGLLRNILTTMANDTGILGRIYSAQDRQDRLREALDEALSDTDRFADLMKPWAPLHNLFGPTNPGGGTRHSLWGTIAHVFDKEARGGAPAPLVILDMSTSGKVSWAAQLGTLLDDENGTADVLDAIRILDQDPIKAAILRKVGRTLKEASEDKFRDGETLNTEVVLDEAWRYAPPLHLATDDEIKALSADLAGYARDTRKFGIGWTYATQATRSLNNDIWEQLSIRIYGYGLGGADLAKVGEQMDDPDHLKLYRGFAPPDSTNPKVYPFMITGPVSPLSFTRAPVFLSAYTNFDAFRRDNDKWIRPIRMSMGLPVLTGTPVRQGGLAPIVSPRKAVAKKPTGTVTSLAAARIKTHAANGGVDPANAIGLSREGNLGGGLSAIDLDDPPPF